MQLARLPRWNWVIIGLIAGLTIGLTRVQADGPLYGPDVRGYGLLLSDQEEFEDALVQDYNGVRLFTDPVVYPHWVPDAKGNKQLVYIVTGRYLNGPPWRRANQMVAKWRPRCVITHVPYRPKSGIAGPDRTTAPGVRAFFHALGKKFGIGPDRATVQEFPSVREFLDVLGKRYGVHYRYAWWAAYPVSCWTLSGLVLIGGIWPTLVNLLAYGTWRRPPEAKPISLWNVRQPKRKAATPVVSAFPVGETGTSNSEDTETDSAVAETSLGANSPVLTGEPVEALPEIESVAKEFAAKEDDYYPTERHTARAPHGG